MASKVLADLKVALVSTFSVEVLGRTSHEAGHWQIG